MTEEADVFAFVFREAAKHPEDGVIVMSTQEQQIHKHEWQPFRVVLEGTIKKCACGAHWVMAAKG